MPRTECDTSESSRRVSHRGRLVATARSLSRLRAVWATPPCPQGYVGGGSGPPWRRPRPQVWRPRLPDAPLRCAPRSALRPRRRLASRHSALRFSRRAAVLIARLGACVREFALCVCVSVRPLHPHPRVVAAPAPPSKIKERDHQESSDEMRDS